MFMTYRFKKVRLLMIEILIHRKNQIEHEIFCIECADKLRPDERNTLYKLNKELLNIQFQIEKEKGNNERHL